MKRTFRTRTIALAAFAAGVATMAVGTQAEAQIQLTPDSGRYLIQRTVGVEEWAISYNFDDGTLTGNVFKTNGDPPSFIFCEFTNIEYADDPADNQYTLDCWGSDACTESPCDQDAWTPIGTDIPLPASFVLPEGTKATFAGNVDPIFAASCALGGCHDAASSQAGLTLSDGASYDNLVDAMSSQMPMLSRVEPFNAADSYVYRKVTGTDILLSQMPVGGMLSGTQMDTIEAWILEGAVRN